VTGYGELAGVDDEGDSDGSDRDGSSGGYENTERITLAEVGAVQPNNRKRSYRCSSIPAGATFLHLDEVPIANVFCS